MQNRRDHIFISYATEQSPLCDWLARKLAAEGYAVWYDRLKMLGGENWPKDIEEAINERTFRMVALLSHASIGKPNPTGEWLKGKAVGNKLGVEDFVIPLNTEGLLPHEIPWNLQPINYVSFSPSWAEGLRSLLKKLESVHAPRVLCDGPLLAVRSIAHNTAVLDEPEPLISNCFEILQIPRHIDTFVSSSPIASDRHQDWKKHWAYWNIPPNTILSFHHPPPSITANHSFQLMRRDTWIDASEIHGIRPRDLMVNLVHRCLDILMETAGLAYSKHSRRWYIPAGLLPGDRVPVTYPNGLRRWFVGVGERKYPTSDGGEMYRYHLSPSLRTLPDQDDPYALVVENHIHLTDLKGIELKRRKNSSRRKHLCRDWFNHEWSARTLGVAQLIAEEDMHIRFGPRGEQQLVINAMPIASYSPKSICDDIVDEPDEIYTTWHADETSLDDIETHGPGQ